MQEQVDVRMHMPAMRAYLASCARTRRQCGCILEMLSGWCYILRQNIKKCIYVHALIWNASALHIAHVVVKYAGALWNCILGTKSMKCTMEAFAHAVYGDACTFESLCACKLSNLRVHLGFSVRVFFGNIDAHVVLGGTCAYISISFGTKA